GFLHREAPGVCVSKLPRDVTFTYIQCTSDLDCTASPHGYCDGGYCIYGCIVDDECGPGRICLCGYPVGHCARATCAIDADCPTGLLCASWTGGCEATLFDCQTPADQCGGNGDCSNSGDFVCALDSVTMARICVLDIPKSCWF
ncbi:MAG TPA: ferritin-like domain-containing protein, partial [Polyangiaceae bacterium]